MSGTSIFETRGDPANAERVHALEKTTGPLPEDYRRLLLEGDGARFVQFNTVVGSEFGGVREIFALADAKGSYRKLPHVMKTYEHRIPDGFLPVADDQAGNLYCLGLVAPHIGQVFFWDHDLEAEEDDDPTMDNMHLVADSFQDMIARIRVDNV